MTPLANLAKKPSSFQTDGGSIPQVNGLDSVNSLDLVEWAHDAALEDRPIAFNRLRADRTSDHCSLACRRHRVDKRSTRPRPSPRQRARSHRDETRSRVNLAR
jgi:hypothetical protein